MVRGHNRIPVEVLEEEEEEVPQQQHQQQHQQQQQQRNRRRRQRNHRRRRNQQQPPVEELPEALWSPEEDRKLFRSVAEYKKCYNSSLNWKTVQLLYNGMGGVMKDNEVLRIQWARIKGLMGAGHFNQLTFLDDECEKDLYLVCPQRASASSSSSRSNNGWSVRSRGYKSLFTPGVAGAIARGYDEQLLSILASNTDAIAELRELGMINKDQEDFAIARYANINRLDSMCEFSYLAGPPQRAHCIGQMMRLRVCQPNQQGNGRRNRGGGR